ncbi:helix-turn-helix transcriptional regulator [Saccharothrix sp. BKS2]|uniref:helix-turn-helix domain-containing protein n=1 Tax=Saccharothrix sp. BKS2 TaxID=3064400 RepID=UPI0039E81668
MIRLDMPGKAGTVVEVAEVKSVERGRAGRRTVYHEVLGTHLRDLRRERKVKLVVIAKRFNVSVARLSKVENGTRGPSPATLAVYSEVLQVPLLDLLANVVDRYRESLDPFDPALRVQLPAHVRSLHGLALYVGISAELLTGSTEIRAGEESGIDSK